MSYNLRLVTPDFSRAADLCHKRDGTKHSKELTSSTLKSLNAKGSFASVNKASVSPAIYRECFPLSKIFVGIRQPMKVLSRQHHYCFQVKKTGRLQNLRYFHIFRTFGNPITYFSLISFQQEISVKQKAER